MDPNYPQTSFWKISCMPESQCNEVFEFDRTLKGKMSVKRTSMRDWRRRLDAASQRKTARHEGRMARLCARTLPGLLQKPRKGGQQGLLKAPSSASITNCTAWVARQVCL